MFKINLYVLLFFILAIGLYMYSSYVRWNKEIEKEEIEHLQALEIEAFENASNTPEERLKNTHNLKLDFKTPAEAKDIFQNYGKEYISLMNQPNLIARGFQSQIDLLNGYSSAFSNISNVEKDKVISMINRLLDKTKNRNPAYYKYLKTWINKICIAKSNDVLESGMPHTIGNLIVMDSGWFFNPRETTLLHEITHVHQRMIPFEFEDLYTQLGYFPYDVSTIKGIMPVLTLNRNNPDGTSPNWLWNKNYANTWWIGAVFNTATPNNLTDINLIALKLDSDSQGNYYYLKQNPTLLHEFAEFTNYFGDNPNNYHPNEMAAKFAEWYLDDILVNIGEEKHDKYEGYRVYKDYFNKLITIYYADE